MSLAEQIGADVRRVFLAEDDFARLHTWQGRSILIVEDQDKLAEMQGKHDDLREASKLLYADEQDIGELPVTGAYVTYDDRRYRIAAVSSEEGMYLIALEEARR